MIASLGLASAVLLAGAAQSVLSASEDGRRARVPRWLWLVAGLCAAGWLLGGAPPLGRVHLMLGGLAGLGWVVVDHERSKERRTL